MNSLLWQVLPFLLRVVSALGSTLLTFVIVRFAGSEVLGIFYYGLTVALGLSILSRGGRDRSIVRFIARLKKTEKNVAFEILKINLVDTLKSCAVFFILAWIFYLALKPFDVFEIDIGLFIWLFPLVSIGLIFSGFYKGLYKPSVAILFELGMPSLLAAIFIGVCYYLKGGLNSTAVVGLFLLANALTVFLAIAFNYRTAFSNVSQKALHLYAEQKKTARSFMAMTFVVYLQQLALVGALSFSLGFSELGVFKAAEKIALIVGFFQSVIVSIYAPHISREHYGGNIDGLSKYIRKSCLVSASISLPAVLIIAVFNSAILAFLGDEFDSATSIVLILCAAQFTNVIAGPAAMTLNMCGYERISKNVLIGASVISVPLIIGASLTWGVHGAAFAFLLISLIHNTASYYFVYNRLGILIYPSVK